VSGRTISGLSCSPSSQSEPSRSSTETFVDTWRPQSSGNWGHGLIKLYFTTKSPRITVRSLAILFTRSESEITDVVKGRKEANPGWNKTTDARWMRSSPGQFLRNKEEDTLVEWIHSLHLTRNGPSPSHVRFFPDSICRWGGTLEQLFASLGWTNSLAGTKMKSRQESVRHENLQGGLCPVSLCSKFLKL
jgi:hypothetical protein